MIIPDAEKFDTVGGKGVSAVVLGETVRVGNRSFLQENRAVIPNDIESRITGFEQEGKTVIVIAAGEQMAGVIAIADTLKPTTREAIRLLAAKGMHVVMITGDNRRTADAIARSIGIERVIAEVLPQEKAAEVKKLQESGEVVAFVGDGINDAPALAQADVGIAIGSGTDVAIESGDIVLIKDDLLDAVAAIELSTACLFIPVPLAAFDDFIDKCPLGLLWVTFVSGCDIFPCRPYNFFVNLVAIETICFDIFYKSYRVGCFFGYG